MSLRSLAFLVSAAGALTCLALNERVESDGFSVKQGFPFLYYYADDVVDETDMDEDGRGVYYSNARWLNLLFAALVAVWPWLLYPLVKDLETRIVAKSQGLDPSDST